MQGKNLKNNRLRKKFSKKICEKLKVGDLLLLLNSDDTIVVGWIVKLHLDLYDTFCAVEWANKSQISYMYIGDVFIYHQNYLEYRKEHKL